MNTWFEELTRLPEITFGAPQRLWFGLPLLLVLLLVPLARGRRLALTPLLLRTLILGALLAVLLLPTVTDPEERVGKLIVLTDVSPSVGTEGFVDLRRLLPTDVEFEPVAFGAIPALPFEIDARESTDIAAALRFAAVHAPADAPLRVVLLSDGRATVPGAEQAARHLRRAGVELFAHAVPAQLAPDQAAPVQVVRLHAPPRERRREPFPLTVQVRAEAARPVTATLYVDGKRRTERTVDVAAGESELAFDRVALEPGRYYVQVVVGDDVAGMQIEVPGVPRVLCLALKKRRALIAEALEKQGIEVTVAAAADPHDFKTYDAVVLLPDAPADDLEKHAGALAEFVGERGGGLLAVGGMEGAGLARLHGTPLAFLLPLDVKPRPPPPRKPPPQPKPDDKPKIEIVEEEKEAFPITLCLVVDRSGSMVGHKMDRAKQAAAAAAFALTPEDRVAVVTFGDEAGIALPPRAAGDPRAVLSALAPLKAEGKTAMFEALEMAHELLKTERTAIRHLVLLSDGRPTDFGRWRDLATTMASEQITLSAVGIGWDIDRRLLYQLSTWGKGRYWSANHPHEIPQVVTQDTQRVLKARERRGKDAERSKPDRKPDPEPEPPPVEPERDDTPPPPEAVPIVAETAAPREMLKGLADPDLPRVAGVEKGEPRFASWIAARAGTDGPPLVAYWRLGVGTAAALTVDPEVPGDLREHRELPRMLGQLLRSILPDAARDPIVVTQGRRKSRDEEHLWIRAVAEDGLARTDLPVELTVGDEDVEIRRTADRYDAVLRPRAEVTTAEVRVGSLLTRRFVLPASVSRELAHRGADRTALLRLVGDPARLDAPGAFAVPTETRERPRPLWLPFLLLAAILLPFDAWARRRARSGSR